MPKQHAHKKHGKCEYDSMHSNPWLYKQTKVVCSTPVKQPPVPTGYDPQPFWITWIPPKIWSPFFQSTATHFTDWAVRFINMHIKLFQNKNFGYIFWAPWDEASVIISSLLALFYNFLIQQTPFLLAT